MVNGGQLLIFEQIIMIKMEKLKLGVLIEKSIARTKQMLFKPFSFKKWLWLLLIASLSGALGGTSFNYNPGVNNIFEQPQSLSESAEPGENAEPFEPGDQSESEPEIETNIFIRFVADKNFKPKEFFLAIKQKVLSEQIRPFLWIIGIGFFVLMGVVLLFTWLYSRFLFIWFNAIIKDSIAIKEPFGRYKSQGLSIFKVTILMTVFGVMLFGLIVCWGLSVLRSSGVCADIYNLDFKQVFKVLRFSLITLFVCFMLSALWNFFLSKFIVLFMAVKRTTFWPGFKELCRVLSEHKKDMFLFVLVSIFLGIAMGIIYLIIFFSGLLISGLTGLAVGGLLYFLIVFLLKLKLLFNILAIILLICFIFLFVLFVACIGLPLAVFFQNFVLYFITNLNCGYDLLALPEIDSAKEKSDN
ncbi:MAG: hypothetical protein KJ915_01955 [Candidatus Omnitrophica bacterium]|nr:hypothetical protein [Candidatus Omnitrophota bacterium]